MIRNGQIVPAAILHSIMHRSTQKVIFLGWHASAALLLIDECEFQHNTLVLTVEESMLMYMWCK